MEQAEATGRPVARVYVVRDCIHIKAPIERCFLLSTNIELMERIIGLRVSERASSRTTGLAVAGDRVVWQGWRYGLPHLHKIVITDYEQPSFIRETVESSSFKRFEHELHFAEIDGHVLLTGLVRFSMPLGALGRWLARRTFVPLLVEFLRERLSLLRLIAESEQRPKYLEPER